MTTISARSAASARPSSGSRRSNRARNVCARCAPWRRRRGSRFRRSFRPRSAARTRSSRCLPRPMPGCRSSTATAWGARSPKCRCRPSSSTGMDPSPGAIADDKGNVVVFRTVVDMYWLERFARHVAVDMGAGAGFATTPMQGAYVKKVAVPGTLTQALEVGRTILEARAKRQGRHRSVLDETTGASALCLPARSPTCGANCAAASRSARRGSRPRRPCGIRGAHRDPEREPRALRRRPSDRHGSRSHHEPRTRDRRADHHRDAALWPADRDHRACRRTLS